MNIDTSQMSLSRLIDRFFNLEIIGDWIDRLPAACWTTLRLGVIALLAGVLAGLLLALVCVSRRAWMRAAARVYIEGMRGTPVLVLILFIHFGFPLVGIRFEPFVSGALALSLNSTAYMAEIFRGGFESVPRGQLEAARSIGMSRAQALRLVVVPQAIRRTVPGLTNQAVVLVKDTTLVSVIGVSEVLRLAQESTGATFNASMYTVAALTYLSLTIPLCIAARRLEKRLGASGQESWLDLERARAHEAKARARAVTA